MDGSSTKQSIITEESTRRMETRNMEVIGNTRKKC